MVDPGEVVGRQIDHVDVHRGQGGHVVDEEPCRVTAEMERAAPRPSKGGDHAIRPAVQLVDVQVVANPISHGPLLHGVVRDLGGDDRTVCGELVVGPDRGLAQRARLFRVQEHDPAQIAADSAAVVAQGLRRVSRGDLDRFARSRIAELDIGRPTGLVDDHHLDVVRQAVVQTRGLARERDEQRLASRWQVAARVRRPDVDDADVAARIDLDRVLGPAR